jgi:inner membrane protein
MDSITQLALGAAVGEATLGSRTGNRALFWGAICGTLPDLDVLVPLGGVVEDFTYHRSATHSLLVMALVTPLVAWLIVKLHPDTRGDFRRWLLLVYMAFATHALLDSHTVYGTQIFWPISDIPVAWSTIFVVDPAYTVPLLLGVGAALALRRHGDLGHRFNMGGLALSSVYLAWSWGAKLYVEDVTQRNLEDQHIPYNRVLTNPGPANTLLWRVLVMDDSGYYEGFYSLLDEDRRVNFVHYPSEPALVRALAGSWPVQRLAWFTRGFFSVRLRDRDVIMTDLRMGFEPDYIFSFKVGEVSNPHPLATPAEQLPGIRDWSRLSDLWQRIWRRDGP